MNRPKRIAIMLGYYDGVLSGFARDVPAMPGASRFHCIAWDGVQDQRLFVVAPIASEALDRTCAILAAHQTIPRRDLLSASQDEALEDLLAVTWDALLSPGARLVFANHVDQVPTAIGTLVGFEARVRDRLLKEEPGPLTEWLDARRASVDVDWLEAIQLRVDFATAGPWTSYIEGRDHLAGSDFIQTAGEDFECSGVTDSDQDFMAHARQDIPRLIEEIRRLRALLTS